jgi:hypothetical protein
MLGQSFSVDLGLVVQHRGRLEHMPKTDWTIGLLTRAISPEGGGIVEPVPATGYRRQPVSFSSISTNREGRQHVTTDVAFPDVTLDWPKITHAAVFDNNGNAMFYGRLAPVPGNPNADEIRLPAGQVRLQWWYPTPSSAQCAPALAA